MDDPEPVFSILELLKNDERKFVMKSVANHLADYLKLNPVSALKLLETWQKDASDRTKWIIRHAKRNYVPKSSE